MVFRHGLASEAALQGFAFSLITSHPFDALYACSGQAFHLAAIPDECLLIRGRESLSFEECVRFRS
jgi:hypothetical protein